MNKKALLIGAGALLLLLVAAFLFLRSPENEYDTVEQLVADLDRHGVECRDLTISQPDQTELVGAEFGFCYISEDGKNVQDNSVTIHVYEDAGLIDQHLDRHMAARGDTENNFTTLVHNSNWIVEGYSEETSEIVQDALGGTIR